MLGVDKAERSGPIREGNEESFVRDVIEASNDRPVIAYFTASWCGPCRTFGPELERAVTAAGGKVSLVKYDADINQRLAAQLRVQSIPAVYAFVDGRPVDMFAGAKSGSELAAFIRKLQGAASGGEAELILEQAEALLSQGAAVEAAQHFSAVLSEDRENPTAFAGMIRSYLALGDPGKASALLNSIPDTISDHRDIVAARAAVELAEQAESAGPVRQLEERLEANADDHQARLDLAMAKLAAGQVEEAVDTLLELFRRDREWQDGAARQQLFKIFDSLKVGDPVALKGRRKLSSMIYS